LIILNVPKAVNVSGAISICVKKVTLEHSNIINDLQPTTVEHYGTLQYITSFTTIYPVLLLDYI